MKSKTTGELLAPIFKFAKRIASALKEKPRSTLDEYVMEHILLYHGLVGSSPENQRQFRDVRADIIEAVGKNSSAELAIALKLPPLWWEDKLQSVLAEMDADNRNLAIAALLPENPDDELSPAADPLRNDDWRVRANAANLLAYLKVDAALPRMAAALEDAISGSTKPAFCHLAYALGRLRREQARQALLPHLLSDEPWFRVDAARALSLWPGESVISDLVPALLADHPLSDYMAVTIAREHPPAGLLRHGDPRVAAGALEMIIGVITAASQTHPKDIVLETQVLDCWPEVFASYRKNPTPRRLRAARALALWVLDNADLAAGYVEETPPVAEAKAELAAPSNNEMLMQWLSTMPGAAETDAQGEFRHAIHLAGGLKVGSALPLLLALLSDDYPLVDEVIGALGNIGDKKAADALVKLAAGTVNSDDRQIGSLSQYPVEEEDTAGSRRYWTILKALGSLPPTDAGISLLLDGIRDFAPDKRQQALESLVSSLSLRTTGDITNDVKAAIRAAMQDPSVPVRMAALSGITQFQLIEDLDSVIKTTEMKEVSLRNQAFETLASLSATHGSQVRAAIETRLKHEHDPHRRKRLESFLENHKQSSRQSSR